MFSVHLEGKQSQALFGGFTGKMRNFFFGEKEFTRAVGVVIGGRIRFLIGRHVHAKNIGLAATYDSIGSLYGAFA